MMDVVNKCVLSPASLAVVMVLVLPGVSALSDRIPVIASSAVALFMLLILIVVVVFATCFAQSWIKSSMRSNGKVKMPKSYFRKKQEIRRRLLAESRSSRLTQETYMVPQHSAAKPPLANGNAAPSAVPVVDKETMVQGWNQDTRRIYEEKGYTMELGDENEEEFRIETTIVDNEILDVGPYRNMESTSARPVDGNVYTKPYLYTNNDRVTVTKSANNTGVVSNLNTPSPNGGLGKTWSPGMDDKVIKL